MLTEKLSVVEWTFPNRWEKSEKQPFVAIKYTETTANKRPPHKQIKFKKQIRFMARSL